MAKKKVAKKAAKTAVKKAPAKKLGAIKTKLSKSQLLNTMVELTDVKRKDVAAVLGALESVISASVAKGAAGQFTLPGLMKVITVRKPATKERKGTNPFTGEPAIFKAKPARTVVKIRALKKLKAAAA